MQVNGNAAAAAAAAVSKPSNYQCTILSSA